MIIIIPIPDEIIEGLLLIVAILCILIGAMIDIMAPKEYLEGNLSPEDTIVYILLGAAMWGGWSAYLLQRYCFG